MRRLFTARPAACSAFASLVGSSLSALLLSGAMGWSNSALAQTAPATPANPPAASDTPANPPANPPATNAPVALVQLISQIDAAANQRNLQAVLRFYSPQFSNSDGLTYQTLSSVLPQVWERYSNLTYKTTIDSYQRDGNIDVVETTTTITGSDTGGDRPTNLTSTIRSRQRIEGSQIVQQEILAETSQTTSGANPPTVAVNLPEQVTIGQAFDFDAIVQEPLENRILLGAVQDEPVNASSALQTAPLEFEVLSAGGLFKQGRAAAVPGDRWISGVIVRDDGITTVSQRMRVVRP